MEDVGRSLGITDRAVLTRAMELALLITRRLGRLNANEEMARPVIALELACQEMDCLQRFDRTVAAKITGRSLPMYMKLCDRIINGLLSSISSSSADTNDLSGLIRIDGMAKHFGHAAVVPAIHAAIPYVEAPCRQYPWRCMIAAVMITVVGHLKLSIVPMIVAEYVHVPWKDVQACVKAVKACLSQEILDSVCSGCIDNKKAEMQVDFVQAHQQATANWNEKLKNRQVAYLLSGDRTGRFAHIGPNPIKI